MAATWHRPATVMLRSIIGDDVRTYTYSDERIEEILVTAASQLVMSADFNVAYTVNLSKQTISPDPAGDNDFLVLLCLKSACLIGKAEYRNATSQAISIKDGPSTIDAKGVPTAKKDWANDICQKYQDALISYKTGNGLSGAGIVGPYDIDYVSSTRYNYPGRREL